MFAIFKSDCKTYAQWEKMVSCDERRECHHLWLDRGVSALRLNYITEITATHSGLPTAKGIFYLLAL